MTRKFNDHNIFDEAFILMAVGDKTTRDAIHESYDDYAYKGTIVFDEFREKIKDLWADNFAKVIRYDVKRFIDKVLYHEDVMERDEELPIRISVGDCYIEIPLDPITQGALEVALCRFSSAVIENYD